MSESNSNNKKPNTGESWLRKTWRPLMAAQYMVVCITDFIVFPVLWSGMQVFGNVPMTQWEPLTLKATGLYHLAMGAICGVSAWTRGKELVAQTQNPVKYSDQYGYNNYPQRQTDEYDVGRYPNQSRE